MQTPNQYGVYEPEIVEEVARCGRAFAKVSLCQCEDRLYRYAIEIQYSTGGMSGPITKHTEGRTSLAAARAAAVEELLHRCPDGHACRADETNRELGQLATLLKGLKAQPSLFDLIP